MNEFRTLWHLRPDVSYLNHGSYGGCPKVLLEYHFELQRELEREPIDFLSRMLESRLGEVRSQLARFLGADPDGLVFVRNATEGLNGVLRSLRLNPGDELLVTNHEYNATRNIVDFVAAQSGAKVVVAEMPFPEISADIIMDRLFAAVTERTRLLIFDHVSSQTALLFPAQAICREAGSRGITTIVDGAHAPGMVPLDLQSLQASYYVGNCHKWMCTPKGAGFLYIHEEGHRTEIRPTVISHGANDPRQDRSRYQMEFDWTGTDDYSAVLTVSRSIDFISQLYPGGVGELMRRNNEKVVTGRKVLCDRLGITPPCDQALLGSMASIPIGRGNSRELAETLRHLHRIEVLVVGFPTPESRVLRVSAQAYNDASEYEHLAEVLAGIRLT